MGDNWLGSWLICHRPWSGHVKSYHWDTRDYIKDVLLCQVIPLRYLEIASRMYCYVKSYHWDVYIEIASRVCCYVKSYHWDIWRSLQGCAVMSSHTTEMFGDRFKGVLLCEVIPLRYLEIVSGVHWYQYLMGTDFFKGKCLWGLYFSSWPTHPHSIIFFFFFC